MNIGIDLDDVIVDFVPNFLDFYNEKFNKNILFENWTDYGFENVAGITSGEKDSLFEEFYNSKWFNNLRFIQLAEDSVNKLGTNHNLFIVTSRPKSLMDKTSRFLNGHFPGNNFKIIFSEGINGKMKADICRKEGINYFVEDNKMYAEECAAAGIKVFLLNKPWNQGVVARNIVRVRSWKEVLKGI